MKRKNERFVAHDREALEHSNRAARTTEAVSTTIASGKSRSRIHLTRREVDVLSGIVRGESNAEIARRLHIREQTVKNHVSVLLEKLHVRNRVQLALLAAREWPSVSHKPS
jgi:DNA-binding NarL/FixJ family response regulator